jgi:acylphosphatase
VEFTLPYYISNNGDGSASVHFTSTEAEADKADEELEEGWGEPCSSTIKIKVENDKLYFRDFQRVNGKYDYVWIEVKN